MWSDYFGPNRMCMTWSTAGTLQYGPDLVLGISDLVRFTPIWSDLVITLTHRWAVSWQADRCMVGESDAECDAARIQSGHYCRPDGQQLSSKTRQHAPTASYASCLLHSQLIVDLGIIDRFVPRLATTLTIRQSQLERRLLDKTLARPATQTVGLKFSLRYNNYQNCVRLMHNRSTHNDSICSNAKYRSRLKFHGPPSTS